MNNPTPKLISRGRTRRFQIISEWASDWVSDLESSRRWKILLDEPESSLQVFLEDYKPGSSLQRLTQQGWEEVFAFKGSFQEGDKELTQIYFLLTPGQAGHFLKARTSDCRLLRVTYEAPIFCDPASQAQGTHGKSSVAPLPYDQLLWSEIPRRRSNDPGSRVAELSRNAEGTLITSLMDCRPNWFLDEHHHPSDVVTFCVHGGGILGLEQKEFSFKEGQLVVIPAGSPHQFQTGSGGALLLIFVFESLLQ